MANSQDIEARLCAYIDGDLTAAQRTEIERHLADHPQHGQMINDLIRTRELIAALPRVKAPADLGEGLQGQLERSMLLGEHEPITGPWRLGSGRVHKLAIMAALVLLGVGLTSVIFVLLRAASHPGHIEAMSISAAPPAQTVLSDTPPPPEALSIPQTRPSPAMVADAPTTNPTTMPDAAVAAAVAQAAPAATQPTTQPDTAMDADDSLDLDTLISADAMAAAATQPADMALMPDPTTQPSVQAATTLPVADDGGEK